MDVIEKFLKEVSWKFDKGYPDITNEQDILMLEYLLEKIGIDIYDNILEEEVKGKATLFEAALVKAWYEINEKPIPEGAIPQKDLEALTTDIVEDAKGILKQTGLTGGSEAKQIGASALDTTEFWKTHGAINKTPKTDIIIDNKKISLKVGPSQLMSGAGNELSATFYAALNNSPNTEKELVNTITDSIKKVFVRGTTKSGNVRQAKQKGDDPLLSQAVEEMGKLKNTIQTFFETNPNFLTEFAYEAATGQQKFGGNEGTADYVLAISSNYKKGTLHKIDKSYAKEIANKMKLDINMKSGSQKIKGIKTGKYNYYTVLRAGLSDLFKDASDDIDIDNEIKL